MKDSVVDSGNFEGGFIGQEDPPSNSTNLTQHTSTVYKILLPKLNFGAKSFYKLVNLTGQFIHEPLTLTGNRQRNGKILYQFL